MHLVALAGVVVCTGLAFSLPLAMQTAPAPVAMVDQFFCNPHPSQLAHYHAQVQLQGFGLTHQLVSSLPGVNGFVVTDVTISHANRDPGAAWGECSLLEGTSLKTNFKFLSGGTVLAASRWGDIGFVSRNGIPFRSGVPLVVRLNMLQGNNVMVDINVSGYSW